MVPFIEGMVDTEADIRAFQSFLQLHGEVPVGAHIHAVPFPGIAGIVHTEAVMVLGDQVDIFGAGLLEELRPFLRVEELRLEIPDEFLVLKMLPIDPVMEGFGGRVGIPVHIPVPLGEDTLPREGRDGIDAPMDEDAELRIGEPLGDRTGIQGLPILFIMHGDTSLWDEYITGTGGCQQM
jgi:hypothetical protein